MEFLESLASLLHAFQAPLEFRSCFEGQWRGRLRNSASVSGLLFFLAKLDPQLPEQIVGIDVARQVLAGVGVAEGLASPRVGDVRPGAGRGLVDIVVQLAGLGFLQRPDRGGGETLPGPGRGRSLGGRRRPVRRGLLRGAPFFAVAFLAAGFSLPDFLGVNLVAMERPPSESSGPVLPADSILIVSAICSIEFPSDRIDDISAPPIPDRRPHLAGRRRPGPDRHRPPDRRPASGDGAAGGRGRPTRTGRRRGRAGPGRLTKGLGSCPRPGPVPINRAGRP